MLLNGRCSMSNQNTNQSPHDTLNVNLGANLLEILTTGMYKDSEVIFREYIQNACDSIDNARKVGILSSDAGNVDIEINQKDRSITITDNGTGISSHDFLRIMSSIASSDKKLGEAKGFRGIGRLCGLAYCEEAIFTTSSKGERIRSIMRCNARLMKQKLNENLETDNHMPLDELLGSIFEFTQENTEEEDSHWFSIKLMRINETNRTLLNTELVSDYVSAIAPVPFQNIFLYQNKIYEYASKINYKLDEYVIRVNGEQIFKNYRTRLNTSKGEDEIYDIVFNKFLDDHNRLIAWSWIGLSHFKAVIDQKCKMANIRLRKENIQIGDENTLQRFFSEDRGIKYFVGEVHAASKELIPNSQRDYFIENNTKQIFERELRTYFSSLSRLFHEGSNLNSAYAKESEFFRKQEEFNDKLKNKEFVNQTQKDQAESELDKAERKANDARKTIEKKKQQAQQDPDSPLSKVVSHIASDHETEKKPVAKAAPASSKSGGSGYRSDKLSSLSRSERKLISKIYDIILLELEPDIAEKLITKIEDNFK